MVNVSIFFSSRWQRRIGGGFCVVTEIEAVHFEILNIALIDQRLRRLVEWIVNHSSGHCC